MTDNEKVLRLWMNRSNTLERENIILKRYVADLIRTINCDIEIIDKLQSENQKLTAIINGDTVKIEIEKLLSEVGGF